MKKTNKSPKECKTNKEFCSQKIDNYSYKGTWILANHKTITICKQKYGEKATEMVTIPKAKFDKLIDWYNKKQ